MRLFAAAAVAALALSACQDPAGVGLGLIDEEQLDPNVRIVPVTDVVTFEDSTSAIGIADPRNAASQPRVLAGDVIDPAFGDVRAVAYLDLLQAEDLPNDAEAGDVSEAWFEIRRSYAYGDTTAALPLELRPIQGAWEVDAEYPADTLFDVGEALATVEISAADSLRRFDLPASWVSANAALLVGDGFSAGFEGFALQTPAGYAPAPGVVFGFDTYDTRGTGLRVVVDGDTLLYPLSEVFTSLAVAAPVAPPAGVLPARARSGRAVRFEAAFADLEPTALARARLRLPVDASLAREGAFVRPVATSGLVYGLRGEGESRVRTLLGAVVFDEDELAMTNTTALTTAVQEILLDPALAFDGYEVIPNPTVVSLDVLPVVLPGPGLAAAPRFTLTLIGASSSG